MSEPQWGEPEPVGRSQAVDILLTVAAPVLAGFSVGTIGLIASAEDKFRWPGLALMLLSISAIMLIASIQFGFRERMYRYSLGDLRDWRGEIKDAVNASKMQSSDFSESLRWDRWARYAYDLGIVVLAEGVAAAVTPPCGETRQAAMRWAAAAIFASAGVGELLWTIRSEIKAARPGDSSGGQ